jgi:hypothetical protein
MATFKNYDPGRVVVVVNGVQIQGFGEGTFVKVSRKTPSFSTKVGAGGDVVRTKSRDRRGTIEITLMQSSPSNDYLSGLCVTDELVDQGVGAVGPALVKELNGTTVMGGTSSWVTQPADAEYAADSGMRTWVIEVATLAPAFVGGLTA